MADENRTATPAAEIPDRVVTFQRRKRFPTSEARETYDHTKPAPCKHPQTTIDGKRHTLQCNTCHAYLDAFSLLLDFAKKWDRRAWQQQRVERADQLIDWLLQQKGRVHITPSGITARIPGPDGAEMMAGGSRFSGSVEAVVHAIESVAEKVKATPPKEQRG